MKRFPSVLGLGRKMVLGMVLGLAGHLAVATPAQAQQRTRSYNPPIVAPIYNNNSGYVFQVYVFNAPPYGISLYGTFPTSWQAEQAVLFLRFNYGIHATYWPVRIGPTFPY